MEQAARKPKSRLPRSATAAAARRPSRPTCPTPAARTNSPPLCAASLGDRLDVLVANAGVSKAATIENTTPEDFDRLFAVNIRAPFFLVQQLLPILHDGSSVILISSLAARAAVGALAAYAASKGAVDTLVKHLAGPLGERGIRVNAVAPGVVATEMSSFTRTEAGQAMTLGMQALKRIAQPDDIARTIAFLASEDAGWITGETVHVDGGSKL